MTSPRSTAGPVLRRGGVRALVVDLDGVLRHFDPREVAAIEEAHRLPAGAIDEAAFAPELLVPAVTGRITDELWRYQVARELAGMFGEDTAAAAITAWAALRGDIDAEVLALVSAISRHTPTVLLTNATTRLEGDLTAAGLDGTFTAVVSSARTGHAKPSPQAFAAAEQALEQFRDGGSDGRRGSARGGLIAYVDDDPANVAAARERGWDAWLFSGVADLRAWLAERGLIGDPDPDPDPDPAAPAPAAAVSATSRPAVVAAPGVEPWIRLGERPGPSGDWVHCTTATFGLPDGTSMEWDLIHEPDAVAVLALTVDGQVLLARQYRPGPDLVLDELPGGLLEEGEDALDAAARELLEETGYAGRLEVLGWAWQDGRSTRRMWTAAATNCRQVAAPTPGPSEEIEVVLRAMPAFLDQLRSGALTDAARAYRALDHLGLLASARRI